MPTATVVTPSSTRSTLQTNFNNLLTQIDQLASDSSYNGINLLNSNNLQVVFNENNTSSLTIQGVNFSSGGLGLTSLNSSGFQDNNSSAPWSRHQYCDHDCACPDADVRRQFGDHPDPAVVRAEHYQYAADRTSNLVLADQNQESANLLTLQTQQQLEISALSIANQANQSVLKLFR